MADFRKWFFAFAVLALMFGASSAYAQLPGGSSSITCNLNPANPTIVSVENITALVGDYVLQCFGGTPTPAGQPIPQFNVTLTLNTNITSRLFGGAFAGYIDALLAIDEPFPAAPFPANAQRVIGSPSPQTVCYSVTGGPLSVPTNCNLFNGTFNPATFLFNGSPYNQAGSSNVFVAHVTSASQVSWLGVPIDAPGTAGTRVIRMTNVRANACQTGLSGGLVPSQINGFVSFNGSQNVVVTQNQQTLAFVQQGLIVSGQNTALVQCNNLNVGGGGIGGNFFAGSGVGIAVTNVNLREGYAASFKRKTAASTTISDAFDANNTAPVAQNVAGFNYNTESAFEPPQPAGGAGNGTFGAANAGDRFLLVFNNVGVSVRVILPQYVALTLTGTNSPAAPLPGNAGPVGASGWTGGWLQLVASASDLNGNITSAAPSATAGTFSNSSFFFASGPFKGPGAVAPFNAGVELSVVNGVATAVYETVNADPFAPESANIPVGVAFISNTGNNLPTPGQTTVTASFAPLSNVNTASGFDPIPRFCNRSTAINTWHIDICTCNLLFPFVTQQGGFDTGIAIANTSLDPYGTAPQSGIVTLNYYGNTTGGGAAPAAQPTTSVVKAGEELTFTLSSGGDHGIAATPGFQGYIIAIAKFQWCHGFAFISDLGAQKLAEGYLAIQLDIYGGTGLNRTGVVGEVQGH